MTYAEAAAYLEGLSESRVAPGLERTKQALAALGDPHRRFPHLLVGGTNGKGSTVAFLASILGAAGWRAGVYTSPHLFRFEERIRVGDECLPPSSLPALVEEVRDSGVPLSYFEFATVMGLLHFAHREVDVAVLEVGLGGRWDATNASDPLISVITTISRDHTQWLGEKEEAIAREKAPIMRPHSPVIIGRISGEALSVLLSEAETRQAEVFLLGRDFAMEGTSYKGIRWSLTGFRLGMDGFFQLDNAACALSSAEILGRGGLCISEEQAKRGLAEARWPGRFQLLPGTPPVLVDAAHNPGGVAALLAALGEGGRPAVWVFSCLADKDAAEMARLIAPRAVRVILAALSHPRAAPVELMARAFAAAGIETEDAGSPAEALARAREAAGPGGRVVVAGSVVLAAAALAALGEGKAA